MGSRALQTGLHISGFFPLASKPLSTNNASDYRANSRMTTGRLDLEIKSQVSLCDLSRHCKLTDGPGLLAH